MSEDTKHLEARVWIRCDSHERLLALRERWVEMFGGKMSEPEPHRRFLTASWESPEEVRGTHYEWELTFRNGMEQAAMALDGFVGAHVYAVHVQPVNPEYPPDTVDALVRDHSFLKPTPRPQPDGGRVHA